MRSLLWPLTAVPGSTLRPWGLPRVRALNCPSMTRQSGAFKLSSPSLSGATGGKLASSVVPAHAEVPALAITFRSSPPGVVVNLGLLHMSSPPGIDTRRARRKPAATMPSGIPLKTGRRVSSGANDRMSRTETVPLSKTRNMADTNSSTSSSSSSSLSLFSAGSTMISWTPSKKNPFGVGEASAGKSGAAVVGLRSPRKALPFQRCVPSFLLARRGWFSGPLGDVGFGKLLSASAN
mmetsp:Transcript_48670/g.87452  ORF Transcript_48670/g.87452 Transcript_48670/m.87452 type:complete len:236 (+) Transcript_48670:1471-2178(+)